MYMNERGIGRIGDAAQGYDAVMGADDSALNAAVADIYQAMPTLFDQSFNVGAEGIDSVAVAFQACPTLALNASEGARQAARRHLATLGVATEAIDAAVVRLTAGMMTANCSAVQVTVSMQQGTPPTVVTASIGCDASVMPDAQSDQVIQLSNAVITVANEPSFSAVLTSVVGPILLNYLNSSILANIAIPQINLLGVSLVAPVVQEEVTPAGNNVLVGYTGVSPVSTPAGGQVEWPAGQVFIGLDASLIDTVATNELPTPGGNGGSGGFDWKYGVSFTPQITITPGAGNNLSVTLGVNGNAGFEYDMPWPIPNIYFNGTISGSVGVSANVSVSPSGSSEQVAITITDVGQFDLNLSISGLPDWLTALFSPIIDIFLDAVGALAGPILQNFSFNVYTLPEITLSFAGFPANVLQLQGVQLSQVAGPDGLNLVLVSATPDVLPAPSYRVKKNASINGQALALALAPA